MKTLLHDEFIDLVEKVREAQKLLLITTGHVIHTESLEKKLDDAIAQYRKIQKKGRFKKDSTINDAAS